MLISDQAIRRVIGADRKAWGQALQDLDAPKLTCLFPSLPELMIPSILNEWHHRSPWAAKVKATGHRDARSLTPLSKRSLSSGYSSSALFPLPRFRLSFFFPFIPMPFSTFWPLLCPHGAFQCQSFLHSFIHILATSTSPVASPLLPPVCAVEVDTIGWEHRIWKIWLEHSVLPVTVCVTLAELFNHATSGFPSL